MTALVKLTDETRVLVPVTVMVPGESTVVSSGVANATAGTVGEGEATGTMTTSLTVLLA
jgi:hypothetical protein